MLVLAVGFVAGLNFFGHIPDELSARLPSVPGVSRASVSAPASQFAGKVVRVSDGDTITVLISPNENVRIRFYGIDAPESGQAFGSASTRAVRDWIGGKMVVVKVHDVDRYGRTIGEIFLPDHPKSINLMLVEEGLAWHYVQFARNDTALASAQREAQRLRRGLWADPNPVPPWDYRRSQARN